jgi:hypothetical protein
MNVKNALLSHTLELKAAGTRQKSDGRKRPFENSALLIPEFRLVRQEMRIGQAPQNR